MKTIKASGHTAVSVHTFLCCCCIRLSVMCVPTQIKRRTNNWLSVVQWPSVKLSQAQSRTQQASDEANSAKSSGNNSGNEQDALKKAKEAEENAKNGVTAAKNNLKAAQQGGSDT